MKAVISEKGQITIPKKLRDALGLKPGQILDFEARKGELVARKRLVTSSIDEVAGLLRGRVVDVDDYLDAARGPAPGKPGRG